MKKILQILCILLCVTGVSYTAHARAYSGIPVDSGSVDSVKLAQTARQIGRNIALADSFAADSPSKAISYYKKALLIKYPHKTAWQAEVRQKLGFLMFSLGNQEYKAQLNTAKSLYIRCRAFDELTRISFFLAEQSLIQGHFKESVKEYTDLYTIQSKEGEAVLAGNTAGRLVDIFLKRKDLKTAFTYADIAKNEYEKVCRRDSLGATYFTIARIKAAENKPKLAEYYIIYKALPYFSASDIFHGRLDCFNFLGHMYMDQKKFSQAKWFILQAKSQAIAIKDTAATMQALQDLVVIKAVAGNYFLARQDLAKVKEMSKIAGYEGQADNFMKRYPSLLKKIEAKTLDKANHSLNKSVTRTGELDIAEKLAETES